MVKSDHALRCEVIPGDHRVITAINYTLLRGVGRAGAAAYERR
jgi:hypothetical protein